MSALFIRRLKAAGFTEDQAEILDTELHNSDILTTKRDLKELETALKHDIELLRSETGRQIAESKAELIRWVIGVGFLQSSLIIGVLLKIGHLI